MSVEHIDAESILDLISGYLDGDWNDGIEAYVSASNDGEILTIEVENEGSKKTFNLTIEQVNNL
jgi:hypothetical protein